MGSLNSRAAEAAREADAHAVTDVTGFGLMGHASEMAKGSELTLELDSQALPLFRESLELSRKNILSGGSARTREFLEGQFEFANSVEKALQDVMFDAETSGGLLIAVPEERASTLEQGLLANANYPFIESGRVIAQQTQCLKVT